MNDTAADHIRVVREALTWLSAGGYNIRTEDAPPELDRRAGIARAALPALDAIEAAVRKIEERARRLVTALTPFADVGAVFVPASPTDASPWATAPDDTSVFGGWEHLIITVGDLRRAALAKEAPDG